MNYTDKLKHPKWQKKRLEILKRDKWKCKLCSDKESMLHVHHYRYTAKEPHDEPSENLVTVCEMCHSILEFLKMVKNEGIVLAVKKYSEKATHCAVFCSDGIILIKKNPIEWVMFIPTDIMNDMAKFQNSLIKNAI